MGKYRIHFTDENGQASFECEGYDNMRDEVLNLREDTEHPAWDIWVESYSEECGWEA